MNIHDYVNIRVCKPMGGVSMITFMLLFRRAGSLWPEPAVGNNLSFCPQRMRQRSVGVGYEQDEVSSGLFP